VNAILLFNVTIGHFPLTFAPIIAQKMEIVMEFITKCFINASNKYEKYI
jgi:hypothetical protein